MWQADNEFSERPGDGEVFGGSLDEEKEKNAFVSIRVMVLQEIDLSLKV